MKKLMLFILLMAVTACAPSAVIRYGVPQGRDLSASVCSAKEGKVAEEELLRLLGGTPLRDLGVDEVIICSNLVSFLTPVAGVTVLGEKTTLALNADFAGSHYFERTVYHEVFHAIERRFAFDESAWSRANPHAIYLEQSPAHDGVIYYQNTPQLPFAPSFITQYAMTRPSEDRAELYCSIMTGGGFTGEEIAMLAGDGFLHKKIALLAEHLERAGLEDESREFLRRKEEFFDLEPPVLTTAKASDFGTFRAGDTERYPETKPRGDLNYSGAYHADPKLGIIYCIIDGDGRRLYAKHKKDQI